MEILSIQFLTALGTIVLMDILLGGDNAVVIAMAANKLPHALRKKAILIGTAGAVIIRLLMTFAAVWLLTIPYLQVVGGLIKWEPHTRDFSRELGDQASQRI